MKLTVCRGFKRVFRVGQTRVVFSGIFAHCPVSSPFGKFLGMDFHIRRVKRTLMRFKGHVTVKK